MMQKLWSLLILIALSTGVCAQALEENKSIEISTKSLEKANKQVQKELNKLTKRLKKEVAALYPDLPLENLDSLISAGIASRKENLKSEAKDSVTNYLKTLKEDLLNDLKETPEQLPIADNIRESIEKVQELQNMQGVLKDKDQLVEMLDVSELKKLNKEVGDLKASFEQYKGEFAGWEDKLLEEITNVPQAKLIKEQMEKVNSYKALPEGYREKLDQFQTNDFVKDKLEAKAEELKKVGETTLQDKFDEATTKMAEAKEKFPSLESVEEAPKRYNPYKGLPFFKRVVLGGNLQVNRQQPASLDAAINLTYPLGLKSAIGVSAATRIFVEKPKDMQTKDNATSIRSFARYNFWKSFYAQGNYEYTQLQTTDRNETDLGERWVQSALIGLGRKITFKKKIQMNFTLFYDLLFDAEKSPNNQAWVMRVGFDLGKKK